MNRVGLLVTLALVLLATARAELAPGLAYVRTTDPLAIVKALETGSVILDLRAVTDEVKPLRIPDKRLLLVLVSPATPAITLPGAITVGRAAPGFKTDLTVTTTAESEGQVLTALSAGKSPDELVAENADKPRFDESTLVRDQNNPAPTLAPADETPSTAATTAKPLVDPVLQRAVQVYRGLKALGKI